MIIVIILNSLSPLACGAGRSWLMRYSPLSLFPMKASG